jgi:hypothetical protein
MVLILTNGRVFKLLRVVLLENILMIDPEKRVFFKT